MLKIRYESTFKKDYKRIVKRGYDARLLEAVVSLLAEQKELPAKYKDHMLIGEFKGCRECHIAADWLLIYRTSEEELLLILTRTGTHSDLFKR